MSKLLKSDAYRLMIQSFQDIVWFGRIDGTCEYITPSVTPILGYTPQELIATPIAAFFHPHDLADFKECLAYVEDAKDVGILISRIRHKNTRYLWFDLKLVPIYDQHGCLAHIVGIGHEVTNRKRMVDRIARAERVAHVGSWERDVQNDTLYWSPEMYRIFGLEPAESLPLHAWFERVHPDDLRRVEAAIRNADAGEPYNVQYRIVRPSGEIRFVHALGEVISEDGVVTTVSGSLQDMTERKQAEEHLLRSKEELKLAQRIAQLGHWNWDVVQNDLYWSDEVYRLFGLSPQDRPDSSMETFFELVHPDDRDSVKQSLNRALKGEPCDTEFRAILPNQSLHVVRVMNETVFDEAGCPVQVFGTVQDMTVQRQTEALLRTSEKLALAGQMAAGIAHEIRNPLTVIKGFIKLIQQSLSGNHQQHHFDILQSELNRIESIVRDLLLFAKPKDVVFAPHDVRIIVQEVIEFLRTEALMKNVHIEVECTQEVMMVQSEANQLKQVFVNVVKNAIEAMQNGGKLFVKVAATPPSVLVQFIDNGMGIPADVISRLGEPFYSTKEGGTGLGLMVSKEIILAHHGTINISSEVGKGTVVTIALPTMLVL